MEFLINFQTAPQIHIQNHSPKLKTYFWYISEFLLFKVFIFILTCISLLLKYNTLFAY